MYGRKSGGYSPSGWEKHGEGIGSSQCIQSPRGQVTLLLWEAAQREDAGVYALFNLGLQRVGYCHPHSWLVFLPQFSRCRKLSQTCLWLFLLGDSKPRHVYNDDHG